MRTLYYCMGGGLGHITRFSAFCSTTGLKPYLATNCEAVRSGRIKVTAEQTFFPDQKEQHDKGLLGNWLERILKETCCDRLIVDSFPAGILGELSNLKALNSLQCEYLARILKLPAYLSRISGNLPAFAKTYVLETLLPQQYQMLEKAGAISLELHDPEQTIETSTPETLPENFWLIIHSGNHEELEQLWLYAAQTAELEKEKPDMLMVSPGPRPDFLPESCRHFDVYPAQHLLSKATRVFSAAGFNIMRQMRLVAAKHHVLPFKRALDDQFFRAANRTTAANIYSHR